MRLYTAPVSSAARRVYDACLARPEFAEVLG
jgi:hypothetical protein